MSDQQITTGIYLGLRLLFLAHRRFARREKCLDPYFLSVDLPPLDPIWRALSMRIVYARI